MRAGERTWFLPTVRNNVTSFLTEGMVCSSAYLRKTAPSPQDAAPGYLILVPVGFNLSWGTGIDCPPGEEPAIIEFRDLNYPGEFAAGSGICILNGVIPVHRIANVHFPTTEIAAEFNARRYSNADPLRVSTRVSPGLFGSAQHKDPLIVKTASQRDFREPASHEVVEASDRLCGSIVALGCLSRGSDDEYLQRRKLIRTLFEAESASFPAATITKALLTSGWFDLVRESSPSLVQVSMELLETLPLGERFGPMRFLEELVKTSSGSSPWREDLDRLSRIIAGLSPMPMDESADSPLEASPTSLLLFLLRPAPGEFLEWLAGPQASVHILTCVALLNGFANALSSTPSKFRPPGLNELAESWRCDLINRSCNSDILDFLDPDSLQRLQEDDLGTWTARLSVDDIASSPANDSGESQGKLF
jgi:hypothetical protein